MRMSGISHCSNEHNWLNVQVWNGRSVCSLQAGRRTTCSFQHVIGNPESKGPLNKEEELNKEAKKGSSCEDERG